MLTEIDTGVRKQRKPLIYHQRRGLCIRHKCVRYEHIIMKTVAFIFQYTNACIFVKSTIIKNKVYWRLTSGVVLISKSVSICI